jgi:hypothetical protein
VGRRHLSRIAAVAALVALVMSAPAAASSKWRVAARGDAHELGSQAGYVALDRAHAKLFTPWLDARGVSALAKVDFSRQAAVAVFGPYGCADDRVDVASVAQHDSVLAVRLVEHSLPPGTVQCFAIFETYRLLTVDKSALVKPYPTRATVTLARA